MNEGLLVVYTGASGVGKGTIMKRLLQENENIRLSVSATTRKPRKGETDGVEYYFVSKDKFEEMIEQDGFLEYVTYCDYCYGTPKQPVFDMLKKGIDVFLEIEVVGGTLIKEKYPDCVSIFLMPPSLEDLSERLHTRGTESEDVIQKRLHVAKKEIPYSQQYDYIVINDDVERAKNEIINIIKSIKEKRKKENKS